jgi:protein-tyrosine phosphatase
MVDLHHHLLPGLDDGSPDLETSLAMARMAATDGITHIVCTPHASSRYAFSPSLIEEKISTLRVALARESIPLTLASGCDFHLSYDNIKDAIAHPRKYSLNATDYLLIELPDHGLSTSLEEIFYQLRLAGLTLILTHPERNPTLQRDHGPPRRLAARRHARPDHHQLRPRQNGRDRAQNVAHPARQPLGPLPRHRRAQPHLAPTA